MKAMKRLSRLGICQGQDTTRKAVDDIVKGFDSKVYEWKRSVEKFNRKKKKVRRRLCLTGMNIINFIIESYKF